MPLLQVVNNGNFTAAHYELECIELKKVQSILKNNKADLEKYSKV